MSAFERVQATDGTG